MKGRAAGRTRERETRRREGGVVSMQVRRSSSRRLLQPVHLPSSILSMRGHRGRRNHRSQDRREQRRFRFLLGGRRSRPSSAVIAFRGRRRKHRRQRRNQDGQSFTRRRSSSRSSTSRRPSSPRSQVSPHLLLNRVEQGHLSRRRRRSGRRSDA